MSNQISHALLESLTHSPLLITDLPQAKQFNRTLLKDVDGETALNTNQKLGHLYEEALNIALDRSDNLSLLGHGIQVFNEAKETIGELDFILHDKRSGAHIHLELGVKFYLAYRADDDWYFPGPNSRDSWPKKCSRLQEHQLLLTQNPVVQNMLLTRYNIDAIEPQHLIYGCLFTPIDYRGTPPKLDYMADGARTGHWLYARQWQDYFSDDEDVFIIPKTLWPVLPDTDKRELFERTTAQDFLTSYQTQGAMFVIPDREKTYFLARNSWPEQI